MILCNRKKLHALQISLEIKVYNQDPNNAMAYVFFALLLFCASVMVHIFFCRKTTRPGLQARAYIFIAMIFMGVYIAGVYAAGQGMLLDPHSLWGLPFKITSGVIFILLGPVYLMFYALTQLMSPSKKILMSIGRGGNLSRADILARIEEEDFIGTRLRDLCVSGCARHTKDRYILNPSGQKIATALTIMQRVLGRDMGG